MARSRRPTARPRPALPTSPLGYLTLVAQLVVLLKLVLVVTIFDPAARDTFTLPKSAVSHALTVLLLGLIAVRATLGWREAPRISWSDLAVGGLLAAYGLAALFGIDRTLSLYGAATRYLGLTHLADLTVSYAALRLFFVSREDWTRLLAGLLAGAVPVIGYAYLQRAGLDPIHYLIDTTRPIATLGNQDIAGGYLGIVLATAFGTAVLLWAALRPAGRAGVVALVISCALAMIFVGIRAGVLGAAAGGAVAVVLALRRALDPGRRRRLWLASAAAAVGLLVLVLLSPLGTRFNVAYWSTDPAVLGRLEIWRVALVAAGQHPLLGLGPDSLIAVSSRIRSEASVALTGPNIFQDSTHDALLQVLVSAGVVGAAAYLGLVAVTVWNGIRAARSGHWAALALVPLAAYLAQAVVNVNDVTLDWILYASAAALALPAGAVLHLPRLAPGGADRWVLAAIVVAIVGWAAPVPLQRIAASEAEQRAIVLMEAGRPLEGVEPARQATAIDPGRARYWSTFATVLNAAGNRSAAISAYREAAAREPWQSLYQRNIAVAALGAGDKPVALAALARALELDPNDPIALDLRARLAYNDGDYPAATDFALRSVEAYPVRADTYEVLVLAATRTGRLGEARVAVEHALTLVESSALRVILARLYIGEGRLAEARLQLEIAMSHDPTNPAVVDLRRDLQP